MLTVVLESEYPHEYSRAFADSGLYRHADTNGRIVIYEKPTLQISLAMSLDHGYIVSITGFNIPEQSTVKFCEDLLFR